MASVTLKNVYKIYDTSNKKEDVKPAVSNFCMEMHDKEFIIFVGPSGCGKSTTLRMIAGLETITSGEIWIGDKLVNNVEPMDRDIAMVFQNYALYPHMTVYKNMSFGLRLQKIDCTKTDKDGNVILDENGNPKIFKRKYTKEEIDEKVMNAAKILGIEEYLNRKPKELSGGQRQRVALGRTIVRKPKVFLLDEPLSNLDAKLRTSTRAEIIKLHEQLGATFIYVTHDQVEAMTMGTRIVVMKDGFIQQIGTPEEIYNNPANVFVAGFIGSPQMNFFKGKLYADGKFVFANNQSIVLPENTLAKFELSDLGEGKEIILGIRPGDLKLVKKYKEESCVKSRVDVVEALGSETIIYADLNLEKSGIINESTDTAITASVKRGDKVARNSELCFEFDFDNICLFDKETEGTLRK
jgi:multiple sugar transport system ATP-binding protein